MKLLLIILSLSLLSCSKDRPPNYSPEEMLAKGREADPTLELVIPKSITESVVNCYSYTPPCRFGYKIIVKRIEMIALYYEDQDDALKAAKRAKAYIARNWVFDDVVGEPILERFVKQQFGAVLAEKVK